MFIEIPANKKSIAFRRPSYGIGINDVDYMVNIKIDGKNETCPFYVKWLSMIERCYSEKLHKKRPTYIDCLVCDEWVYFSNFKLWMITQDWKDKDLDKDIIKPSNKIYSPEACCFVPPDLNALLTNCNNIKGKWPKGVTFDNRKDSYQARLSYGMKRVHLGCFKSPELASSAYVKAKVKIILKAALEQTDQRIANGLRLHAELLSNGF